MVIVSVVMPVYNAEAYLSRSIQSVLAQTFCDFELILINDGSGDLSYSICKEFASMDQRIRVINQENRGPSAARNRGIKEAKGKYLCFIDSDDAYLPEYLEIMIEQVQQFDFVSCGIKSINDQGKSALSKEILCHNKIELNSKLLEIIETSVLNSPVNKIYKTEMLKRERIFLNEGMDIGEDYHFNLRVLQKCESFTSIKNQLYLYYVRKNSISSTYKKEIIEKRKKNIELTEKVLSQANIQSDLISKMKLKLIYVYMMQLEVSHEVVSESDIKRTIFDAYFNDINIQSGISYIIMALVYKTSNLFAIRALAQIMNKLRKIKGMRLKGGSM